MFESIGEKEKIPFLKQFQLMFKSNIIKPEHSEKLTTICVKLLEEFMDEVGSLEQNNL